MFHRLVTALSLVAMLVITGASIREDRAEAASQVIAPTRVMDTRSGLGIRVGRLAADERVELQIGGVAGGPATAVFLNLTTVEADEPGYVTAWPCDQEMPSTSIVNFFPGRAVPNMVVLAYPESGVCFSASSVVHLVVDITAITTAGEISGIAPQRLLDSRQGQALAAGVERPVQVAGTAGVPPDAAAAAVNVTIVDPVAPGFAVVKPCGAATDSSSVNFMGSDVVAHLTFTALSTGSLCVVSSVDTHVIVDSFAWTAAASTVQTLTPGRVLDTRTGLGAPAAAIENGASAAVTIGGVGGVPTTAGAATINLVASGTADGFLTAWPCDADLPLASTVNLRPGGVASNQATIKLDAHGRICVRPVTADGSPVHVVADVVGYVAQTTTITLPPPTVVTPEGPAPIPESPDAVAGGSRANATAGTNVGSSSYPAPAGALYVAPSGNDAWPGTKAQPFRTVTRAIARTPVGGTIVLRGGTYFESVNVNKRVTIQAAAGEAVWFDGSTPVTGWVANGTTWRYTGWTIEFDTSPTYSRGAPDNVGDWSFLDPAYPLAAHPDQLFIDGIPMRQVATRSAVVAGTFFHDRPGNALYVGTNPIGRDTRAAALIRGIRVTADGVVLKGFGVRRYSPSVPDMGSVTIERSNVLVENVAVVQSATTGISVAKAYLQAAAYVTLRNVWVASNGFVGIHGNFADGLTLDNVLVEGNNAERFKPAPAAAGMKITAARQITIRNSVFRHNFATGLWFDQSNYDVRITGSDFRNNQLNGVFVEISAQLRFVDNVVAGNGGDGLLVNNTNNSRVWNNTFVDNMRNVHFGQDDRRPATSSYGQDPRYPNDPTMTWLLTPVEFNNNVVANPKAGAPCLICFTGYMVASTMGIKTNGNVYNRTSASAPSVMVYWSTGRSTADRYPDLATFTARTGNDANGRMVTGAAVVTYTGTPTAQLPAASGVALGLPSDLATLIGRAAGVKKLGAWT